ncbi:response regulator transcription factor [Actinoplanes sp. TRM 88003]|uniref:Response regulator transcription factor n=1 Tax=Paractinoplanes aksuensis TaxID=2939490 RepID=A0ABT1DLR7_9ACTN|nr:response regulator transcription factor [Actinoplanes aksuensis]MCO8271740.1 response regulator transcription factor [Actinoplanes aksuensis]
MTNSDNLSTALLAPRGPTILRVVVACDHPLTRTGLVAFLASCPDIDVLAATGSGPEVVRAAAEALVLDVVLLEVPGADGTAIELIGRLGTGGWPVRVLALAAGYTPQLAWAAVRAGAAGFLLLSRPPEVLLGAVRAVATAGVWLDDVVVRDLLLEPVSRTADTSLIRRLTVREREVLVLLAHGLGNAEIAERLWLSDGTVRTHIGRILMKLECRDRTRAVVVAYRSGLVRVLPAEPVPA